MKLKEIIKLSKNRSLYITLQFRYICCMVFSVILIVYGLYLDKYMGKHDIGLVVGIVVILLYLVMLVCLSAQCESFFKSADPLNIYNKNRYILVLILEVIEMLLTYFMVKMENKSEIKQVVYVICIFAIMYICKIIHNSIFKQYKDFKEKNKLNELIDKFTDKRCEISEDRIDKLYKDFYYFMGYNIFIVYFTYRVSLINWYLTVAFIILNLSVIVKIFKDGIKEIMKNHLFYMVFISLVFSAGTVLLKAIHDGLIDIAIFHGRDDFEYLMCVVLFYFPLSIYGYKLFKIKSKAITKWIE